MKFKLIFTITLIFLSCTKNSIEKEIPENIKLIEEIRNYEVSIFSSEGGTISVENVDYNSTDYTSSHQSGTILNLNAEPKEGFKFIGIFSWLYFWVKVCQFSLKNYQKFSR